MLYNIAYSTYCLKKISINNMGEPALKHLLSKKPIERSSKNPTSVNI